MLFLLIGVLLVASILVLLLKKSKESLCLFGMCASLLLQFSGILIFIAKKGGYSREMLEFLFFSLQIKTKVQYLFVTLDTIGSLISIGRHLFPLFLLLMALHYSMHPWVRRHTVLNKLALILPVCTLILYCPPVFRSLAREGSAVQDLIVQSSYLWTQCYVALALFLLAAEYFAITMRFCRRQFGQILVGMAALAGLYLLYCGQDPGQVYRFYSYGYVWSRGIGYLQYAPSLAGYLVLVVVNVICGVLGFTNLFRYTQNTLLNDRDEVVLARKFDIARTGASVFVHSIKNQLLANRVLYKRVFAELDKPEPDLERLRESCAGLRETNELLIERSEELYRTVKSKSVLLTPVTLETIAATTLKRFYKKYPEGKVETNFLEQTQVLADENYLSEALYNLLINGWEANLSAGHNEPVRMFSQQERLYTVLEVRDCGGGIARADQRRIFEPFYSSKNTNYNWGMGLYHVRAIVKSHLGSVRVESVQGKGSSFFIMLPRYDMQQKRGRKG